MAPTLSLCMTASGPPQRVRRILEAARPTVDEIVLGVDTRGEPGTVEACADLADRLLPFESPGTGGGLIGWILEQAGGDWILRLDDDEMPSRALLEALPALTRDREATHILVRRRWLFPDGGRYITSHPWWPDVQLRLLRNLPGIWRFGGRLHDPPEVLGARRFSDTSIYHADCVLRSLADRRAKAARYERMRPGIRSEDFPLNAVYVPEDCLGLETKEVPECDAALVAQLLEPTTPRASEATAATVTPAREITRHNRFRPVSPGAYGATIRLVEPRSSLPAGTDCRLQVEVANLGDEVWPAQHVVEPPFRLGHRWLDAEGGGQVAAEGRTLFGASVAPGATALVELIVHTPEPPGVYVLELDMVHEDVRWFDCAVRTQLSVEPPLWAAPMRPHQPRRGLVGRLRSTPEAEPPARARPEDRRFHASYGLNGMDLRLAELLGREDGVFVEAGANDGVSQSNTLLLERSHGWSGLLIEPVPSFAERCRRNRPGIPVGRWRSCRSITPRARSRCSRSA